MNSFAALPSDTRRALARAELKRRGLRTDDNDPALTAAFAALRAGVATLPGFTSFSEAVCALADRIDADTLTIDDKLMLSSLPDCSLSPAELVRLFADIERAY